MEKSKNIIDSLSWKAELSSYKRIGSAFLCRPLFVAEGDSKIAPGYTLLGDNGDARIFISHDSDIWDGDEKRPALSPERQKACRKGIFGHELLHQRFTNFKAEKAIVSQFDSKPAGELFAQFANILEDPAIEYMAELVFGGPLLKSLQYVIAETYKITAPLEEAQEPLVQYIAALIMFGDMGILKGNFTFPESEEVFLKTAPLFFEGIHEPNGYKRLLIAKKIMEEARPLWEELVKEQEKFEEVMKELRKTLAELGKSAMSGSGFGETGPKSEGEESSKDARRKITIKKVSKEEFDEMKGSSSSGGELPEGDITIYECDEADGEDGSGSGLSLDGETENDESENGSPDEDADGKDSDGKDSKGKDSDGKDSDGKNSDGKDSDSKLEKKAPKSKEKCSKDHPGRHQKASNVDLKIKNNDALKNGDGGGWTFDEAEYELTEEDVAEIRKESERERMLQEKAALSEEEDFAPLPDFDITSPALQHRSCLNINVSSTDTSDQSLAYAKLMHLYGGKIKSVTSQIKKIFEQDYEETLHHTSGKVNLLRSSSGRVSSRIFDRRRLPTGKRDLCVFLLVDESGSMCSNGKDRAARECCIALAEIFKNLDVPCYIMGFTADEQGHDVVHFHYTKWKNTLKERWNLLNIQARSNNLDGYSIRYATQLIKKRNETNKLLIVLSDGQPAASRYNDGIADTKAAVRDAKKYTHVLGVAIGNSDTETIHYMYEREFLHASCVDDLFFGLAKELKNMFKSW